MGQFVVQRAKKRRRKAGEHADAPQRSAHPDRCDGPTGRAAIRTRQCSEKGSPTTRKPMGDGRIASTRSGSSTAIAGRDLEQFKPNHAHPNAQRHPPGEDGPAKPSLRTASHSSCAAKHACGADLVFMRTNSRKVEVSAGKSAKNGYSFPTTQLILIGKLYHVKHWAEFSWGNPPNAPPGGVSKTR
ncbi:MAG: hypothetical protein DCC68_13555 [Planctomycetota bacterium]|nr:MAG: hypothetical protein DCC68_13555 [Planctomycetota bacterium]